MFGAISGIGIWLSLTFAIAFYLVGLGEYITQLFEAMAGRFDALAMLDGVSIAVAAAVGGILLVILNLLGAKSAGRTQVYVVLVLIAILAVFAIGGLFHLEPPNFTPFFPEGTSPIFSTTALVFVSFLGFVKIAAVSEEIENPAVNLPRALIGSVAIVTALLRADPDRDRRDVQSHRDQSGPGSHDRRRPDDLWARGVLRDPLRRPPGHPLLGECQHPGGLSDQPGHGP